MGRIITLDRDHYARARDDGMWIFSGQDDGRSVRVAIADRDWSAMERRAGGFDAALRELERLAGRSTRVADDGFGGFLVMVGDGGDPTGRMPDSLSYDRTPPS